MEGMADVVVGNDDADKGIIIGVGAGVRVMFDVGVAALHGAILHAGTCSASSRRCILKVGCRRLFIFTDFVF
jgi:hypothetical protein